MTSNNFALTTLSQNPEYFEEVIQLIEEGFHYSELHHYEKDFAPLVDPMNFENCYLYIDAETSKVAAHLAVCIRTLIQDNCEMKVALIGGIVTNKDHRNRGLFKNLMEHVLSVYREQASLFILWSDLEGIYEKFYFYRTGGMIETGKRNFSSSERPGGYEKTRFPALSEKDFENIINLYNNFNEKKFFTVKRDEKDWSILKEMNSIDLYIKKNNSGEIIRYFCVNKGRDLTNIIHEISCLDQSEYLLMLKELEGYKIWLPETELDKINSTEIYYTAFMKIGNLTMLNNFLTEISNNRLLLKEVNNEAVIFEFKTKTYEVSPKDFLQHLFGPNPLEEFAPYALSLYIPGADSI
ncbi:MAG: GNAT family N-acetyltransferase [Bacteriovorax sp.]|jgi:hypothetical protein